MLKAIDVQQVVLQIDHVERIQRAGHHQPDLQQRYLDMQAKEEHKLRQERVPDAEEAQKTLIRDQKGRGQERSGEQGKRSAADGRETQDTSGEDEQNEAHQGGHINIKV